jgi:GNAT superfamily N-acetyltransferase
MLRLARAEDAPELDDVLADSFFDDPISVHLLPDAARRRDGLRRGMGQVMRTAYMPHAGAWTTEGLDGVALWAKPGDPKPSALQQLRELPIFARAFGRRLPRAMKAFATAEKRRPEEDHWFLDIIGVRPERQGEGIGSALLRAGLAEVDKDGVPAFLVTSQPRNVPFYEWLGFGVTEEYDIGPVHVWPMLRMPATAVSGVAAP